MIYALARLGVSILSLQEISPQMDKGVVTL